MEAVVERFLKYVTYDTQSEENSDTVPSTKKQLILAEALRDEMIAIGLSNVRMFPSGIVFGEIPASAESEDNGTDAAGGVKKVGTAGEKQEDGVTLGFIAHMDTAEEASGSDVKPRIIEQYAGGDILLENGRVISAEVSSELEGYKGQDLIVTDGRTLLGADDKAGIAEIMTMAERLLQDDSVKHGKIVIAFTTDEEIGNGIDQFDVKDFGADFAYTVDGGRIGEIEYENFNGASAAVEIRGVSIHPGSAKGVMKNAITIGQEFDRLLPQEQRPEFTEGYEGYFYLMEFKGSTSKAELSYLIREHDAAKYEEKKQIMEQAASFIQAKYGDVLTLTIKDGYKNMKEKILPHMHLIDTAAAAFESCGVTPSVVPIRGGTDGAELSYKGLPCPNLSTGGENFHSETEYIPVQSMVKMVDVLTKIAETTCRHQ